MRFLQIRSACSFDNFLAASQNARSYVQTIDHRTLRICKKRIQKVLMLPLLLIHDLSFSFIYIPYNEHDWKLPQDIVDKTIDKYFQAYEMLTGKDL